MQEGDRVLLTDDWSYRGTVKAEGSCGGAVLVVWESGKHEIVNPKRLTPLPKKGSHAND